MLKIGVLASHQGTNFQAVTDACTSGRIDGRVVLLISNNSSAPVMERAGRAGIRTAHLSSHTHPSADSLDNAMYEALASEGAELIVLAGYMKKLGPRVLSTFRDRIINVHPALLPSYGGKGFYGSRVHEAVIAAGDRETGATVHLVNEEYDAGDILLQQRISVEANDTADTLAARIHPIEHELLITAIQTFDQEFHKKRIT